MNFDVRLQRRNPPVVEVTWQPPQQTFGLVRGYKLVYFVPSDERVDSVEQRIGAELRSFSTSSLRNYHVILAMCRSRDFSAFNTVVVDHYNYVSYEIIFVSFCHSVCNFC